MPDRVSRRFLIFIVSWLFAFLALFFNSLFQPHFQWNLKLLEIKGESARLENPSSVTTVLSQEPNIKVYSKEGFRCLAANEVTYIQNKLIEDKLALAKLVEVNMRIGNVIFWIAMLNALGNAIYVVILRKVNLEQIFWLTLLLGILGIILVTILGPLGFPQFACWSEMKIEAELVNISLDGLVYFLLSWLAIVISFVLIVINCFPW